MSVVAGPAARSRRPTAAAGRRARITLDGFELATFAVLLALSFAVLAGLLVRVWARGGVVTGGDGFFVADPLQYLNWLRQMGEHGAAANLYDLRPGPRPFVHPGLIVSGLLHRLGLGLVVAYAVWKPVACAALFAGVLLTARRHLQQRGDRRLALVLGLFACSPVAAVVGWAGVGGQGTKFDFDFISGELWAGSYLWGYLFTAIAVGLMPLGLLAYERGRAGGRGAMLAWAAAAGLLCAWFQPWQGATYALVLVGAEGVVLWRGRSRTAGEGNARPGGLGGAVRDLIGPLVGVAAPLAYYLLLSRLDASWELAGTVNDLPRWPWWVTVLGLAPLAVPAGFAYRLTAPDFGAVALRAWPLAGLLVFALPFGTFPFHAFQGLTIPLVVLGVLALRHQLDDRPVRLAGAIAAVLVLAVLGTAYRVDQLRDAVNLGRQPFFLATGEHDALRWLDSQPRPGGVLTPVYSGIAIPAYTGRETWVGAQSWTPDFLTRREETEALFGGRLDAAQARSLVRRSGAAFVYADCHGRADIAALLGGIVGPAVRFGCATVYPVRAPR